MADLKAIYEELGLPGLIPYALTADSNGQRFVIEKIKEGAPLWYLRSTIDLPFVRVFDGSYNMMVYTDPDLAEAAQDVFRRDRYETTILPFPAEGREEAVKGFFASGPDHARIDDAFSFPLRALTDLPNYDGRPTTENILLNRALNGAISYFFQIAFAQKGNPDAERRWAEKMSQSEFLVAVQDDHDYPFLIHEAGPVSHILVFTDWNEVAKVFPGELPVCIVVKAAELRDLIDKVSAPYKVLLNESSCHCILDHVLMAEIDSILAIGPGQKPAGTRHPSASTLPSASQVGEEDWDTADPTPDWLK